MSVIGCTVTLRDAGSVITIMTGSRVLTSKRCVRVRNQESKHWQGTHGGSVATVTVEITLGFGKAHGSRWVIDVVYRSMSFQFPEVSLSQVCSDVFLCYISLTGFSFCFSSRTFIVLFFSYCVFLHTCDSHFLTFSIRYVHLWFSLVLIDRYAHSPFYLKFIFWDFVLFLPVIYYYLHN